MTNETTDYNRPSMEGWRDGAGFATEKLQDLIDYIDECKENVDKLMEAARTRGIWHLNNPYFEDFEPDDTPEEEIEAYAKRILGKWSESRVLLDQAKTLVNQAKSNMAELIDE